MAQETNTLKDPNRQITAEDVKRFFSEHTKTKKATLELLRLIGVRFDKQGNFSHVIPV